MKTTFPMAAVLTGATIWFPVSQLCASYFPEEHLFGHLLASPINAFTLAAFFGGAAQLFLLGRGVRKNSRWRTDGLLPKNDEFHSYADVRPFSQRLNSELTRQDLHGPRLLHAVFEAVHGNWSTAAAHAALDAESKAIKEEVGTKYRMPSWFVFAVAQCGFFGTVLGFSQALPHIHDSQQAAAFLHVAFDTTIVAIALGLPASFFLTYTEKREELVLAQAADTVHNEFVLRIRAIDGKES